jgi:hypothetical protein
MVLFAAAMPADSERYRTVAGVVETLFAQLEPLQAAPHHAKWSEVNLAADLPGWKRFPPAAAWLKRNAAVTPPPAVDREVREIFAKFLDERSKRAGARSLSLQEKDQLLERFEQLRSGEPR